jgi:hypothetical protein
MDDKDFIQIVKECKTMHSASTKIGVPFMTFKRRAKRLGCYEPNQGGKGIKSNANYNIIPIEEILNGKHPQYGTYHLKIRLIREGIIKDECSICGWKEKFPGSEFTPCELDHIDGNSKNHKKENLRILCPNCHSLTFSYRFRRGKINGVEH